MFMKTHSIPLSSLGRHEIILPFFFLSGPYVSPENVNAASVFSLVPLPACPRVLAMFQREQRERLL